MGALTLVGCSSDTDGDAAPSTTTTEDRSATDTTVAPSTTWSPPACPDPTLDRSRDVRIADPDLDEVSGAAVSARDPQSLWVMEDSGNPAVLTALSPTGATTSTMSLTAPNTDWEDMSIVHRDGAGTIFVGDIGDNQATRNDITVLRVDEPDPHGPPTTADPDVLHLRLPAPANAEALLVDPLTGDIVIVTKAVDGTAQVLVADGAAGAPDESTHDMTSAGNLGLGLLSAVIAGDVAPDGSALALRTPTRVLWWPRDPSQTIADTLTSSEPCTLPSVIDPLGEAIALLPDGGYLLAGEGANAPLHQAR